MRYILIALFAMVGAVMANDMATPAKLATGAACKQDGSIGICTSNFCLQTPDQATGVCQ